MEFTLLNRIESLQTVASCLKYLKLFILVVLVSFQCYNIDCAINQWANPRLALTCNPSSLIVAYALTLCLCNYIVLTIIRSAQFTFYVVRQL